MSGGTADGIPPVPAVWDATADGPDCWGAPPSSSMPSRSRSASLEAEGAKGAAAAAAAAAPRFPPSPAGSSRAACLVSSQASGRQAPPEVTAAGGGVAAGKAEPATEAAGAAVDGGVTSSWTCASGETAGASIFNSLAWWGTRWYQWDIYAHIVLWQDRRVHYHVHLHEAGILFLTFPYFFHTSLYCTVPQQVVMQLSGSPQSSADPGAPAPQCPSHGDLTSGRPPL